MNSVATSVVPFGCEQKIQGRHHERLAVVYVRQSTIQQVQQHQESTQVQYGLVHLAKRLGWPRERILVVDDDLGVSGASAEGRPGFQRLLSEVALEGPELPPENARAMPAAFSAAMSVSNSVMH